ncbi:membrane-bound PQQ-dependent dehydrogenase, glucose/quinate/shikimate family [Mesorhizobium sp. B3-1-3]|uniref:membrane-bound PQQ-dependent dehydrogenase, glucose/quinate/shikimate family n=1 Tax=unclassified Mesorhizobium TaxID=325217 RepID=UPI00112B85A7|nr:MULTISPECIES: membrane-bound PQQ-dependent dehydrogenase, glucose/quinate/shikimate family [unclassified Mesorhizobium]TPI69605.1 membrane-bound PQQ-dependent dehydrogenase, glucose/quinate/shikimate family [Mesorhizobium sp. B3-1-8]TPI73723.1 membrane-bound PQQ-dependent dehydrogenase, glucose/quinate/shikimate family [Mesorhizobium sp. B3-1-3]
MTDAAENNPHRPLRHRGVAYWWRALVGILLVVLGLLIGCGGAWLVALGGSWYYLPAGIALLLAGILLLAENMAGVWLYVLTWLATLAWAYWEVGLDGWALMPRVLAPTIILIFVLLAVPAFRDIGSRGSRNAAYVTSLLLPVIALGAFTFLHIDALAQSPAQQPAPAAQPAPNGTPASPDTATHQAGNDWPVYGGSELGTRYSPLNQITATNVSKLTRAWSFHTGDMPNEATKDLYSPENTPLAIGGHLYACSAKDIIISADARSGKEEWRYDPKVPDDAIPYGASCRGVAYFAVPGAKADQACATRILIGTLDARLIAIDAKTGKPCTDFGQQGIVDLTQGIGETVPGWYSVTAPPTIVRGIAVVGAQVKDGQAENAPSGVVRGYDATTGKLAWAWDMGHPDRAGAPPAGDTYTRGTPNMWTVAAADPQLGYVYLPLGNAAVDYYGIDRKDFENQFNSSIVAIDVMTGKPAWHFQTVHHDLWDYDLGSQPTLVDFPTVTGKIAAIIVPSKQGQIYVLDRKTGKPLFPVEERNVPSGGVEPDKLSKTQPYSGYAHLDQPVLTEKDMWGMSPLDQLYCRIQFHRASYQGEYTPPTVDRPFIEYPGYNGGSDWGSIAVDTDSGVLIANYNDMPNYNQLIPREKADQMGFKPIDKGGSPKKVKDIGDPQAGSPYAIAVNAGWRLPTGLLCSKPPYGHIRAIDLKTGRTLWDEPLGSADNNGPFGLPSMLPLTIGTPNNGGPLVTAGGLIFIAATTDNKLRAIDIKTGKEVWHADLPAGGQTTPMTYEVDGRQYIVIAPGGHHFMETKVGDEVIAYALPAS